MRRLNWARLAELPADIGRPRHDRAATATGILHLGLGAFHRGHQAAFTQDCLDAGETGWGIAAASLRSAATRDALAPQDGLYALALQGAEEEVRVVGALNRILVAPEDPTELIETIAAPQVRIVSLTVTEKGYGLDPATGDLRETAEVAHDLAHPHRPRTVLGFLAEGLARRRGRGIAPPTLLSCDNLAGNGRALRRGLEQFARLRDAGFADWVAGEVACPSSMVDRIVPATTDADRDRVSARLGLRDEWPVVAEPFAQWVIEDDFPLGRPGWERSGVEFVADVGPHEAMKLRLLNGAHSLIAAMGRVAGHGTIDLAVSDPAIAEAVAAHWREVAPTLPMHLDVRSYTRALEGRFANPALGHRTAQVATDASQKIPPRWLAPLRELRALGAPTPRLEFALAAWVRSCEGRDEGGAAIPVTDPVLEAWVGRPGSGASPEEAVRAYLGFAPVFGTDLVRDASLVASVTGALATIRSHGVRAAARAIEG